MVVTELYIYPIKSLRGIKVQRAFVREKGFKYDRRWMLVDENNNFITQRKQPNMALLKVAHLDNQFVVSTHDDGYIEIPESISDGDTAVVTIWDNEVEALVADNNINDWFSEALKLNCKLAYMPLQSRRPIDTDFANKNEAVSFADEFPYLIIGESSFDDLNNRLREKITIERFRPNIVYKGAPAFEEDGWGKFKIGDVQFYGAKQCGRCVFTTINPDTGEKGKEPLATLTKYRQKNNKVYFGINVIASDVGDISVGDRISISTWK